MLVQVCFATALRCATPLPMRIHRVSELGEFNVPSLLVACIYKDLARWYILAAEGPCGETSGTNSDRRSVAS